PRLDEGVDHGARVGLQVGRRTGRIGRYLHSGGDEPSEHCIVVGVAPRHNRDTRPSIGRLPLAYQLRRQRFDADGPRLQHVAYLLERRQERGDQQLRGALARRRAASGERLELGTEAAGGGPQRRVLGLAELGGRTIQTLDELRVGRRRRNRQRIQREIHEAGGVGDERDLLALPGGNKA